MEACACIEVRELPYQNTEQGPLEPCSLYLAVCTFLHNVQLAHSLSLL